MLKFCMNTELLVTSALRLAADQYGKDAEKISPIPGAADSYKRQKAAATALAHLIDERGLPYAATQETVSGDCPPDPPVAPGTRQQGGYDENGHWIEPVSDRAMFPAECAEKPEW